MSLEITKPLPMLVIALIAVGIILAVFLIPMIYNMFIGRSYCKFLGNTFVEMLLGGSILNGPTKGGVSAGCEMAVPV